MSLEPSSHSFKNDERLLSTYINIVQSSKETPHDDSFNALFEVINSSNNSVNNLVGLPPIVRVNIPLTDDDSSTESDQSDEARLSTVLPNQNISNTPDLIGSTRVNITINTEPFVNNGIILKIFL